MGNEGRNCNEEIDVREGDGERDEGSKYIKALREK